jgi:hypothetical protein
VRGVNPAARFRDGAIRFFISASQLIDPNSSR